MLSFCQIYPHSISNCKLFDLIAVESTEFVKKTCLDVGIWFVPSVEAAKKGGEGEDGTMKIQADCSTQFDFSNDSAILQEGSAWNLFSIYFVSLFEQQESALSQLSNSKILLLFEIHSPASFYFNQ